MNKSEMNSYGELAKLFSYSRNLRTRVGSTYVTVSDSSLKFCLIWQKIMLDFLKICALADYCGFQNVHKYVNDSLAQYYFANYSFQDQNHQKIVKT